MSRPSLIAIGPLEIDSTAHRVRIGLRDVRLTTRAFALLELFARHADELLSRSVILDQVWDWAFDGDPRIIDVYVRTLRLALGDAPGVPRIETVRGAGYVLRTHPRAVQSR